MQVTKEAVTIALALQNKGNVAKFLSIEFLDQKDDCFFFDCFFPEEAKNPLLFVQGGFIASALDDATAVTVSMHTGGKKLPNSTDIHVTFHRPLSLGKARMKTQVIKLGKRIVSVEGKIYTQKNKLAASMLHTAMLFDPN